MKRKRNKPAHQKLVIPLGKANEITPAEKMCYKSVAYEAKAISFKDLLRGWTHEDEEEPKA